METMQKNVQGSGGTKLGGSEKFLFSLKIPNSSIDLFGNTSEEKLVTYFQNNAAKTYSFGLKISDNFQIKLALQPEAFFHLSIFLYKNYASIFKVHDIIHWDLVQQSVRKLEIGGQKKSIWVFFDSLKFKFSLSLQE